MSGSGREDRTEALHGIDRPVMAQPTPSAKVCFVALTARSSSEGDEDRPHGALRHCLVASVQRSAGDERAERGLPPRCPTRSPFSGLCPTTRYGSCRRARGRTGLLRRFSRRLPTNLVRRLVFPQPHEDGVAQQRLLGPTKIGNLGNELGPNPVSLRQRERAAKATSAPRSIAAQPSAMAICAAGRRAAASHPSASAAGRSRRRGQPSSARRCRSQDGTDLARMRRVLDHMERPVLDPVTLRNHASHPDALLL